MGGDAVIKSGVVSNREGYPLNSVFGLKYCGRYKRKISWINILINMPMAITILLCLVTCVWEIICMKDVNKDGKLTEADYVYLGTDDRRCLSLLMPDYRGKASMSRLFSRSR